MPSAETFSIPPIADLLDRWLDGRKVIVDPFARNSKRGTITNDLNPETAAQFHLDARAFCVKLLNAPGLGYHIRYAHESVSIARKGDPERPAKPLLSVIRAVADSTSHPHQKPMGVMLPLVEWCCPFGGIVIDPFMGSGTTLVAAKQLGIRAIGIEVDEVHCATAVGRLAQGVLFGAA